MKKYKIVFFILYKNDKKILIKKICLKYQKMLFVIKVRYCSLELNYSKKFIHKIILCFYIIRYQLNTAEKLINLIIMSSSLPRLRAASEKVDYNLNNQAKFKKLKLGTEASIVSSLSKRHNSSQRLNSLQRYTSMQQQRDARNEKIQLNVMERKLLTGRYDQTLQTGNDLAKLKGKADQFKSQAKNRLQQTQKVRKYLNDVKKQINEYTKKRKQHQDQLKALQQKVDSNQKKVQVAKTEKHIYEHMFQHRNQIILHYSKQVNEGKSYLMKLKSFDQIFEKQLRQATQKLKILQKAHSQLQDQLQTQRSQRQQLVIYKQNIISSRVSTQMQRQGKMKKYHEIVQDIQRQEKEKQFHSFYDKILVNVFLREFLQKSKFIFQTKYEDIDSNYRQICRVTSVPFRQPKDMTQRFLKLQPQKLALEENIKERQNLAAKLQQKRKNLQKQLQIKTIQGMQTTQYSSFDLVKSAFMHAKNEFSIEELITFSLQNKSIKEKIGKFAKNGLNRLQLKQQKGLNNLTIIKNFKVLLETILKQTKLIEQREKKLKQQQVKE